MNEKLKSLIYPEKKRQIFCHLTLSGILSGLCMAFPTLVGAVIEWFAFIPAALALHCASKKEIGLKQAFGGGFWLIYSQNVIVYHWFISFYPLEFTGMSKLGAAGVVIIAVFGLPILAAVFGGVLGMVTVCISRLSVAKKYPIALPFVYAAAYVLCECVRTKFWFGVPWGRLSLGQLVGDGAPISVLSSSVFGTYFVTFLIVLVSCLIAQALIVGRFKLRTIISLALVLSNLLCGVIIAAIPTETNTTVKVAAVQANINSRDKWNASSKDIYLKYEALTKNAASDGAELIVWPETAITDNRYITVVSDLADDLDVYILFGCFDYTSEGPQNILSMATPEGEISETAYAKRHLVPFGEYVPMRNFIMTVFPPLGEIAMLSEDLIPGDGSEIFEIEINGEKIKVGGLICFDSIYEQLAYSTASDGADIICVATNDSWFEDSRAVYMHCAQSRLRAIETGLPIVRAANTGISANITPLGKVTESIEPLVDGYMVSEVSISRDANNARVANSLFLLLCAACVIALPIVNIGEYDYEER